MMSKHLLLAQLLCVLVLAAHAAPQANIRSIKPKTDKYGIMPSRDFISDMCKLVDNAFQMVPWPVRMDGVCSNFGLNDPNREADLCPMFDLAKMFMGYLQASYPMQCAADSIPEPSSVTIAASGDSLLLPTPFTSQLTGTGMPSVFSESTTARLLKTEGPSYYWLYKSLTKLIAWAPCGALGWDSNYSAPKGWETVKIISAGTDLSAYEIQATAMPFAAILRRPASAETTASCQSFLQANAQLAGSPRRATARLQSTVQKLCSGDEIAVLVRGTATASDWAYNFDMALTANSEYGSGKIHRGFQALADTLWTDGLKQVLDEVKAGASRITFAGHSLGASTAALLAARSQKYLTAARSSSQVTAVLFGSPNVGDAAFADDFNSRVDTRNIEFQNDMVAQVPCEGSMIQCSQDASATASGGNHTIMSYPYARLGGRMVLRGALHMPMQSEAWDMLSTYTQDDFCDNMMSMANLLEATHICSYMCAMSSYSPDNSGDWCLLWDNVDARAKLKSAGPSFCMTGFSYMSDKGDFPTFPMFPSFKSKEWLQQQPMRRGPQNTKTRQPTTEQPAAAPESEHAHHG